MKQSKWVAISVGIFILIAIAALLLLAFKVSDFSQLNAKDSYKVTADFDNIGSLKPRAAITISGVKIGQVESITLNPQTFRAEVALRIYNQYRQIPADSSASIVTAGLLGSNYISLMPGFETQFLGNGDTITDTHPAIILEDMIGQLLFSLKENKSSDKKGEASDG